MKKIDFKSIKVNKKIWITIGICIATCVLIIMNVSTETEQNVENNTVIEPEKEIAEVEQNEETQVKLYLVDKTSGVLTPEVKKLETKKLIDNPYIKILQTLIDEPSTENLINEIPKETKVNNAKFEKGILTIDLSEDFLNASGTNAIYQIVDTITELNEVEGVKFTFNGKVNENMQSTFVRK